MKPILMLFATREGQTEKVALEVAARVHARGRSADVRDVRDVEEPWTPLSYGAVFLAASVHAGRHEREMVEFVRKHRVALASVPTAFLSISLSEAAAEGHAPNEEAKQTAAEDVEMMLEKFFEETGWRPDYAKPVAGALMYSKYGFVTRLFMKRIARKAGAPTDTSQDYEYTDWDAIDRFVDRILDVLPDAPLGAGENRAAREGVRP